MNGRDKSLIGAVSDLSKMDKAAVNIRKNGKLEVRQITKDVEIVSKEDGSGIDIYVAEDAKSALVFIPVVITISGLTDLVYNDFHIGKNANVTIMAGCAINNPQEKDSTHQGIHRFFVSENANVTYLEKHYGEGDGRGHKILDPVTEINLKNGSTMKIDTTQIEGVDRTVRKTKAIVEDGATLIINEKIMTSKKEYGKTEFDVELNGVNATAHVVSRSVAVDDSKQVFVSNVVGNKECYAHIECDAIIKDRGVVQAIPEILANTKDARLVHEATIGKIAGEQLLKLMSLGLSEKDAEAEIIKGFLK